MNDNQPKRLYKSSDRGKLAGVSVGLADYVGVDVTIIRLAFVLFALAGGPGLLVYIIMALVLPDEKDL